jgi:hypothetical protein
MFPGILKYFSANAINASRLQLKTGFKITVFLPLQAA